MASRTASGPKIIQLCYERLDRDLDGALLAIDRRDITVAHELLCHAQDIVHELLCMLDLDRWEHAGSLAAIYRYVLELLTEANVKKSAGRPAKPDTCWASWATRSARVRRRRRWHPSQARRSSQFSARA